jgi:hypothetical protein
MRGPYQITDSSDNLAYYYKDYNETGTVMYMNCLDTKLKLLTNQGINFTTFLPTDVPKQERILALVKNAFYIFMPNGKILSEVQMRCKALKNQDNIDIKDVSDNIKYFIFNNIERVYELCRVG